MVKHYPDAPSFPGGFLLGRLPEEHLFQNYFGFTAGCHYLNDRTYYGLHGYVTNASQLGPGYLWSDFWQKVCLLVVARHWKQLPEILLRAGDDECYHRDPLLLVLMVDAWRPKIYGQRKDWQCRTFLTEMTDRMLRIAPTYSPFLLHSAIGFQAPSPHGKDKPEDKEGKRRAQELKFIRPEVILEVAKIEPASLTRCCPALQFLTPVALAAERDTRP